VNACRGRVAGVVLALGLLGVWVMGCPTPAIASVDHLEGGRGPYGLGEQTQACGMTSSLLGTVAAGPWPFPPSPAPAFFAPPVPLPLPVLVPYPWYPGTIPVYTESTVCTWQWR
jgi:hypothetical protein